MEENDRVARVHRYHDMWVKGSEVFGKYNETLDELCTDDYVYYFPDGNSASKDVMLSFLATPQGQAMMKQWARSPPADRKTIQVRSSFLDLTLVHIIAPPLLSASRD